MPCGERFVPSSPRVKINDICPSVAKNENVHVRTLHEACLAIGGEQKLAEYLGVEVRTVEAWLAGRGRPPDSVFLRCVDLVLSRNMKGPS